MKHVAQPEGRALVFVPTFNERDNVEKLCSRIVGLDLDADILFMDDNSPDGTGEALDRLARSNPRLQVVHRAGKLGIGSAHLEAIRLAYARGYQTLVTMDCDFNHKPEDLPQFLEASRDADVVVGSRYLHPESLSEWSPFRKSLTRLGHFLTRVVLGMRYDATGGFRLYRLDRIPAEAFELARSTSYSFFFESLYILFINGFRVKEIPIELPARTYGHSKMRAPDIFGSLLRLGRTFLTTHLSRGTYRLDRPALSSHHLSGKQEIEAWDQYWVSPSSSLSWLYGVIAGLYRVFLIKPNLNRLVARHFPPGSRVLHAGCGSGQVDTEITTGQKVIALDFSAEALRVYDRLHDGQCSLVRGTILSLPIGDDAFDGIYHLGVLEHFSESEIHEILSEFNRVLKHDGKMIVFWPPQFGLSVRVLGVVHFILNKILRRGVKLHPDEITLLKSRSHAVDIFERAQFVVEDYSFGLKDMFTYCMVVVSKRAGVREEATRSSAVGDLEAAQ